MTKTVAELIDEINTQLPTNNSRAISAAVLRPVLIDMVSNNQITLVGGNTAILSETRSFAQGTTFPAIVNGGPSHIMTGGFAVVGDGGHGLYARLGADPVSSNKGYFQSLDGAWWGLVSDGGTVRIEQFGGGASYVNTGAHGTDNYQPLLDATTYNVSNTTGIPWGMKVELGLGSYFISQLVDLTHPVWISGKGNGSNWFDTATKIYFPRNAGGFIFQASNTGPSRDPTHTGVGTGFAANDSIVENFGIFYEDSDNSVLTEHAIQMHCAITVKNIWFHDVPGDAINIYANGGYGNANHFTIRDCQVHNSFGHGMRVEGGDTNAGNIYNFYTHQCGKCGIMEDAFLGNHYFGLEIDGYGNTATWNAGKTYQQIGAAPRIGVAPYSDLVSYNEWLYIGDLGAPNASFIAWDSLHQYTTEDLRSPIMCYGPSEFYSVYAEFGVGVLSHAPAGISVGGTSGWTQFTSRWAQGTNATLTNATGVSSRVSIAPADPGFAANGSFIYTSIGNTLSQGGSNFNWPYGNVDLQLFERETDGRCHLNYDNQNNITWTWNDSIYSITGPNTTTRVGPNRLLTRDIAIQDPGNANNLGILGIRDNEPIARGLYLIGSRYFVPTGVYVVTTSGAIAAGNAGTTWFNGSVWSGGDVVKAGVNFYRVLSGGTSTVEPVHVAGSVTESDGLTWLYLISTDVIFTFEPTLTKAPNAYNATNVTPDRAYDANATTLDEVADVLGTLISDLRTSGLLT